MYASGTPLPVYAWHRFFMRVRRSRAKQILELSCEMQFTLATLIGLGPRTNRTVPSTIVNSILYTYTRE